MRASFYKGNCRYLLYYRERVNSATEASGSLAKSFEAQKVGKNSSPQ